MTAEERSDWDLLSRSPLIDSRSRALLAELKAVEDERDNARMMYGSAALLTIRYNDLEAENTALRTQVEAARAILESPSAILYHTTFAKLVLAALQPQTEAYVSPECRKNHCQSCFGGKREYNVEVMSKGEQGIKDVSCGHECHQPQTEGVSG